MCLICDRIEMIKNGSNPYFVKEMKTGYVVIGDHQRFKGYTLFLYKRHETELFHLDMEERCLFLREMSIVAHAAARAFGAQKMNYELLGMGDSHMHWHLFPRAFGDLGEYGVNGNGPVWLYPRDKFYDDSVRPTDDELQAMVDALRSELDTLDL